MKYALMLAFLLFALSSLNPAAVAAGVPAKPFEATGSGDLNGDGALTLADHNLLCDHLVGKATLTTAQQAQADLNGDGKINVADLIALINLAHTITINLPGTPPVPLEMVICPAGSFKMGRNVGELDSSSHESPRHTVTFSHSFCLGKYEVTKRQWQAVMGTTPWVGQQDLLNDPNSPAVYISWSDITKVGGFLDKLNQHLTATGQGGGVRLPTEAEWEYACRAGTTTRFYWGDDLTYSQVGLYAWYEVNAQQVGQAYAHPVGMKLKNLWGLFDMSGNAWEWCQDYDGTYSSGSIIDPTGPVSGTNRILRGGCSVSPGEHCRSACRIDRAPTFLSTDVGFRLAWTY